MNGRALSLVKTLWAVFFALGILSVAVRFASGREIAAYGGYVPWGLWVAVYVYFVGLSAGAFLLSALIYVFGIKSLEKIGKLALYVSFITLLGALVTIFMDLGHPFRFWKVYTRPNFFSMMAWMIWLYSAYFLLVVLELRLAARRDLLAAGSRGGWVAPLARLVLFNHTDTSEESFAADRRRLQVLGMLGVPLAISFHGGVGALFGVVGARPFWNASIYPLIFLGGALLSGTALLTFIVAVFWSDRGSEEHRALLGLLARATAGLLVLDVILQWAEFSISYYAAIPAHALPWKMILFGDYWWVFWIVHVLFGLVVPGLLLASPRTRHSLAGIAVAAFLIAFTFLSVRVNIVIPGLALEELAGLKTAYADSRLHFSYFPSFWEFGVTFFSYTFVMLLFYLGCRNLALLGEATAPADGGAR